MNSLKKILGWLDRSERLLMVLAFVIMVATMFGSVLARNVFRATVSWLDELARISMVYMVLLGAEAGLRDGTQVRVTAGISKLHGGLRKVIDIVAQIVLIAFTAMATRGAIVNVQTNIARNVTTTSLNWPMAIPYMALVIGFTIMTLVQLGTLVKMVAKPADQFGEKEEQV
ncbi:MULTISPECIES: TRAP transporter small permease [unclassified Oscillibacter]|uniref:TRAP transporter small permease n=1 Tax=unclassified Oscillibacter TaxID=2629304 RepID=UPI0025D460E3|nr:MULTISPECIES: TRAP transporter small permease [unclassified Oscillibacter]